MLSPNAATLHLTPAAPDLETAGRLLAEGGLVAFPTETVYGLGADAANPKAVARIFSAKNRPQFNPLIAHVADIEAAFGLGVFSPLAERLARAFWPGPLTLVVPAMADCPVCDLARAGLGSIAIRVPAHPLAQAILRHAGRPVVAPSANRSGRLSPSDGAHVHDELDGRIDAIVYGGPAAIGVESTILACFDDGITLLRPGGLARAAIERVTGGRLREPETVSEENPLAPGRLASHYAPRARLRLNATSVAPGEACLAFGVVPVQISTDIPLINLSEKGDLVEAAANLYHFLRILDGLNTTSICVMPIPSEGLGEAIMDRLERAAAPRQTNPAEGDPL